MQELRLKAKGIYSYPNALSEVPEGALKTADNVVINADSVVEPRRGYDFLTYALPDSDDRGHKFAGYQSKILLNFDTNKLGYYDSGSGWQTYSGSFQAPDLDLAHIKFVQAASNLYFTTSTGVKRLDAYNGTPGAAGGVKALDVQAALTGSSGFMPNGSQVAYRCVWGIRDSNNNLILGAPSARATVSNASGGTRDTTIVVTIPAGITTSHFVQVYRSGPSASASTEPNDELGLIYEANPTSGEISTGTLSFTDQVPDSLRGVDLYTNASQEGSLQANDPPPYCKDLALFSDSGFYANVKFKQRKIITLLSVGGASGVAATDDVVIAGTTYRADGTTEDHTATPPTFKVFSSGTAAQNIADTAQSLCRVINKRSGEAVYAFYLSGYNELPGKIMLEERSFGGSVFYVTATAHGSAWSPALPTSGTTIASRADEWKNGLAVSKTGQPDSAPETNLLFVGGAGDEIRRILALRDSLFVLKDTDGIYRVSGSDPSNFSVELFDATTRLLAPETAVVLNNQIWCLSDQGVVAISDTGVEVKSLPIEDTLLRLFGTAREAVRKYAFAVASETDRRYILFLPSSASDTYATQAYAFSTATQSWTRWPVPARSGFVNPADDKIYLASVTLNKIRQERKSFTALDFMDEGTAVTIVSATNYEVVLSSVADLSIGDLLYQASSIKSVIVSINTATNTVTVADDLTGWVAGSATVYKSFECVVEWVPQFAQNPGVQKHYSEAQLFFAENKFVSASIGFASDLSAGVENVPISGTGPGLWGLFGWGSQPWGAKRLPRPFRTLVPLEKQRCSQLSVRFKHKQAQGSFRLTGLALRYALQSTPTTR